MERVALEKKVLNENDRIAAELRARFEAHGILCLNIISSPGSGKTSLLERTLESFPRDERVAVLTGDIQTENDATRLRRFSREANHHRRHLSPRCSHGRTAPRRLATGRPGSVAD